MTGFAPRASFRRCRKRGRFLSPWGADVLAGIILVGFLAAMVLLATAGQP